MMRNKLAGAGFGAVLGLLVSIVFWGLPGAPVGHGEALDAADRARMAEVAKPALPITSSCAFLGTPNGLQAQYNALAADLELPEDLAGNGLPDREALEWVRATLCAEDAYDTTDLREATQNAFTLNAYLLRHDPEAASLAIYHPVLAALLLLDDATQAALYNHLAARDLYLTGAYATVQCVASGECAPMAAPGHALWAQYQAFLPEAEGLHHPYGPDAVYPGAYLTLPKTLKMSEAIKISDIESLQRIGNDPDYPLNGYYRLTQDIDASVTASWNNGLGFEPIGDYYREDPERPFNGILDGQGFVISGLHIDREVQNGAIGLFGYTCEDSVLYRIGLEAGELVGAGGLSGGLVGSGRGMILQCYTNNAVTGGGVIGGLVGEFSGILTRSFATGPVFGTHAFIGGLGGNVSGAVTECFATGNVEGGDYAGGLLGAGEATITRSYALGDVHSEGISGGYAGGLVAWKIGGVISECYAVGAVTGAGDYIGALVGSFNPPGTMEASFWDVERSGVSESDWGEGRSTTAMQSQSTFTAAGWDFDNDWGIDEGVGYPYLRQIETVTLQIFRWPTASTITFGQSLADSTLTKGAASAPGNFTFDTPGAILQAGTHMVDVTYTPEDTAAYETVTESIAIVVAPATPTINAWPTASDITYGEALSDSTLSGGSAAIGGNFRFEDASIQPEAGNYDATVRFEPLASNNYETLSHTVTVVVHPLTPEISAWPEASPIPYGAPLSASSLEGGVVDLPGSFVFDEGGLQLEVGVHNVTVVFAPEDSENHASVSQDIEVEVHRATPEIQNWPSATAITYGQTLADSSLEGGAASVPGAFVFVAPDTAPDAGVHVAALQFQPEDSECYVEVNGEIEVTVHKADTEVSAWPTATTITYGQSLGNSTLSGGEASVPGSFAFAKSNQQLPAGQHSVAVIFTPTDNNYWSVEGVVEILIEPATPEVALWPNASDIDYGDPLSESILSDGLAGLDGVFEYADPSLILEPGDHEVTVTFYPGDTANFVPVSGTVTVTVIPPPTTEAPQVVGMRQADAEAAIMAVGLDVAINEVYSETVAEGRVVSQDPAGGSEVEPDATITIHISLGPEKVAIPDLVGMTQAEAAATLSANNLSLGQISERHNDSVPAGAVISQHPPANTPVSPGSTISLVVSLGSEDKVPVICGPAPNSNTGGRHGNFLLILGLVGLLGLRTRQGGTSQTP